MARPKKKGLDYFPFDVDFFSDRKIRALKGKYGNDGVIIYIYLLTMIYNDNGYYTTADDDLNYILADTFDASDEKIGQIINFLLERSLFDDKLFKSDKVFTSRSIQLRYQEAKKGAKRDIEVEGRLWLLKKDETESFIQCTHFQEVSKNNEGFSGNNDSFSYEKPPKEKESKEKKNKGEKRSIEPSQALGDKIPFAGIMAEKVSEWLKYKAERKQAYKPTGLKTLFNTIQKNIDRYGEQAVIDVIDSSITNNWQGLFFERIEQKPSSGGKEKPEGNQFLNLMQDEEFMSGGDIF